MISSFPAAEAVAARLDVRSEAGSTNAELREVAGDTIGWPHLSVLVTDNQTAGRGRLDRVWTAPPGASLAISVLLRDLPESVDARGWIPLISGMAMADAVQRQIPDHVVTVKWPNDVLVDGRKICGVLAEAVGDAVIVGAGVNTAMTSAQLPVDTATSFAALGLEADHDRLLVEYLTVLSDLLTTLITGEVALGGRLHAAATARCATVGRRVRVLLPGGGETRGIATGLDALGRLLIDSDGTIQAVSAGDIVHVRSIPG